MATALKLKLCALGISQQRVIRAAAKEGRKLNCAQLSMILAGHINPSVNERISIMLALKALKVTVKDLDAELVEAQI
jgi:hypothetical protein